jgi:hypothetical protein
MMGLIQEIDYGTPASAATGTVTLTIDGVQVTVPAGTSIMRAAQQIGTSIPKLCATDMLEALREPRSVTYATAFTKPGETDVADDAG